MRHFAAIAVLLIFPTLATAQGRQSAGGSEWFGVVAVAWLNDDEGSLGSGLDIGVGGG